MNTRTLNKEIKDVFIPPKKVYYFGKLIHGSPFFYPMNFNKNIISLRKLKFKSKEMLDAYDKQYPHLKGQGERMYSNLPMVRRAKNWILKFKNHYWLEIGWPIMIHTNELGWKTKYDSVRFEWAPAFYIFFFHWQFCIWWNAPDGNNDKYYEMILWYLHYSDKDIVKAKDSWMWVNCETKLSTWNDNYLIK
jgi:hypothetical protein